MEILGIGPTEFLFIIIILLLVLGPADLVQLGQKIGRLVRKMRDSETWLIVSNLASTLRNLPNVLAEEAGTDEIFREVLPNRHRQSIGNLSMDQATVHQPAPESDHNLRPPEADTFSAWTTPPKSEAEDIGIETDQPEEMKDEE